jgi:hypothetical protein
MEPILNLIINRENVRMLVIIAFVCCGYVLINSKIDDLRHTDLAAIHKRIDAVDKRIDGVEASIKELKYNDFAHLSSALEALTYALEKNGSLKPEDKAFVDSRLAR